MYGPQTLLEAVTNGVGIERPFLCPVHGDTRPSASVNVLKGVWYCYTCGAHGKVEGEHLLGDIDFKLVGEYIGDLMAEPHIYPESWLNQFDAAGPGQYWLNRFTPEACEHFRLGQDHEGRPTYPLRDERGQVLGVVTRSNIDRGPKYLYPKGIDIGLHLFSYTFDLRPVVVLVEGAADAIAVWEAGYAAFAIYGSKLSDRQVELIRCVEPDRIITCFDQDEAGRKAAQMVAKAFPVDVVVGEWLPELGDIADMQIGVRKKIIQRLAERQMHSIGSNPCESTPAPTSPRRILTTGMRPPSWP